MKANANAFYALNGNSVIDFKESSKAKDVCEFLERIKKENDCGIIVTLDNSKTHHADITVKKAKQLDMIFVFLPAYSPDLNPLEYIWKSIRKDISKEIAGMKEMLEISIQQKSAVDSDVKKNIAVLQTNHTEVIASLVRIENEIEIEVR